MENISRKFLIKQLPVVDELLANSFLQINIEAYYAERVKESLELIKYIVTKIKEDGLLIGPRCF